MKKTLITALLLFTTQFAMTVAHAESSMRPLMPDSFHQVVADHKGKQFVVLVWSLDCQYCQRSFKTLADAQRDTGLNVVTIVTDHTSDTEAIRLARKKLVVSGLKAEMWAFGDASTERLRYSIDPAWRGEVPRSYWFNARGEVTAHSGIITAAVAKRFLSK